MSDTKTFTAVFKISDYFSAGYDKLQKKVKGLTDTTHTVSVNMDSKSVVQKSQELTRHMETSVGSAASKSSGLISQVSSATSGALGRVSAATKEIGSSVGALSGRFSGAFSAIRSTVGDTTSAIKDLSGSMATMAAGGVVAGYSFLSSAKGSLYKEQVYDAIEANRKLNVSRKQLQESAIWLASATPGSVTAATEELYNILSAGGNKYLGKSDKATDSAKAIAAFTYSKQEMLGKNDIQDSTQLIRMATMTEGELGGEVAERFQAATGLTDAEMKTAQGRMRALIKKGQNVDLPAEVAARPWTQVEGNLSVLQGQIGGSMTSALIPFTQKIADIIALISSIPNAPALIGLVAMLTAAAGATSMLISVFTPLYMLLSKVGVATRVTSAAEGAATAVKTALFGATNAQTASIALATGATEAEAAAFAADTAAQNTGLIARAKGTVANGLHTISVTTGTAANWLRTSSMAALALITGVLTGEISLNTVAMTIWNATVGAGAAILGTFDAALFAPLAALGLIAAVVGVVLWKTGALSAAWKALSKVDFGGALKDLMSGNYDKAWRKIEKGFGKVETAFTTQLQVGLKEMTGLDFSKGLDGVTYQLSTMAQSMLSSNPYIEKSYSAVLKVISFFEWIYSLGKSFYSWLQDAMPGAKKQRAETSLETDIAKINKKTTDNDVVYNKQSNKFSMVNAYGAGFDVSGESGLAKYIGAKQAKKLYKEATEYQNAPSFAEGIANAVKEGLIGLGDDIANSISTEVSTIGTSVSEALTNAALEIPGMSELVTVLTNLNTTLSSWYENSVGSWFGGGKNEHSGETPIFSNDMGDVFYGTSGYDIQLKQDLNGQGNAGDWLKDKTEGEVQSALGTSQTLLKKSYAAGATFQSSGRFSGDVHDTEEIIPQAITKKGAGPISRAVSDLLGSGRGSAGGSGTTGGREVNVTIYQTTKADFAGAKFDANFDVKRFIQQVSDSSKAGAIKGVKDQLGQRTC